MKSNSFYVCACLILASCAPVDVPGPRNVNIPAPQIAEERQKAVNEVPDSVVYLPLGEDVLIPATPSTDPLPSDIVGPFELRSESLAGALQLILSDYEIPLAFETEEALERTVTVSNMRGPIELVVRRICGLADLYCAYDEGILTVREFQTFTVSIPPVGGETDIINAVSSGIDAITGQETIVDEGTRTIIYSASHRTSEMVERYFQRMRNSTALVIFDVNIWEVNLDNSNSSGINWQEIIKFSQFETGFSLSGSADTSEGSNPISIGLPTSDITSLSSVDVFEFISTFGAVKTISQPQITMLSGSEATLRAVETENFVSSLERTVDDGSGDDISLSTQTDSVDTGFTLTIGSNWDNSTVYGTIEIELDELQGFSEFDTGLSGASSIRLPNTSERELTTQVRIRPGDSLLVAGLVREVDNFSSEGPGVIRPVASSSRAASVENQELVFLLRPRVIVYTTDRQNTQIETRKAEKAAAKAARQKQNTERPEQKQDQDLKRVLMPLLRGSEADQKPDKAGSQDNSLGSIWGNEKSPESQLISKGLMNPAPEKPQEKFNERGEISRPIGPMPIDLLNPERR